MITLSIEDLCELLETKSACKQSEIIGRSLNTGEVSEEIIKRQGRVLGNISKAYEEFSRNELAPEGLYTVIRDNIYTIYSDSIKTPNKYDKNIYQVTEHRDALLERIEEYKRAAAGLIEQRDKALKKLEAIALVMHESNCEPTPIKFNRINHLLQ